MGEPRQLVPAGVNRKPRDHHHRIAYLVATGMRTGEIARSTGMSVQRVSYLKTNEEFQELVKVYRDKAETIEFEAFRQVTTIRAAVEQLALEEIRDRLEESPELFANRDLMEIQADMADRLGRGKINRQESVSLNVDLADSLAEARRRELRLSASPPPERRDAEGGGSPQSASGPAPT